MKQRYAFLMLLMAIIIYTYQQNVFKLQIPVLKNSDDTMPSLSIEEEEKDMTKKPSLDELVRNENDDTNCNNNENNDRYMIYDHHLPYDSLFIDTIGDSTIRRRRIPRIVHQTSKSRCVTTKFKSATSQWKLGDDWAYYLHTNEAVDRFLQPNLWPEFPTLAHVLPCMEGQWTLKADLWRYLILWQYGGIYADIDTKPSKFNATSISIDDDGFFVVEMYHLLSQYFMATSPKHPIMYYTIQHALSNILTRIVPHKSSMQKHAPFFTGPHALNKGFQSFMADRGIHVPDGGVGKKPARAGVWVGTDDRSIRVVGMGEHENEYVIREYVRRNQKLEDYDTMGMQHFLQTSDSQNIMDPSSSSSSCIHRVYDSILG